MSDLIFYPRDRQGFELKVGDEVTEVGAEGDIGRVTTIEAELGGFRCLVDYGGEGGDVEYDPYDLYSVAGLNLRP